MEYVAGKRIGPTFAAECAGLADRRFSWGPDGRVTIHDDMAAADQAALVAVIVAHDPTKPRPPKPDVEGFEADLVISFGGISGLLAIVKAYPASALFWRVLEGGDFAGARQIVDDALAARVISAAQHTQVLGFAAARAIPW